MRHKIYFSVRNAQNLVTDTIAKYITQVFRIVRQVEMRILLFLRLILIIFQTDVTYNMSGNLSAREA